MTRIKLLGALLALGVLTTSNLAFGASYSVNDSLPSTITNWNDFLTVAKFNPALGTLTQVNIFLDGDVSGTAKYESQDGSASVISLNLQATITLQKPDLSFLVDVVPLANVVDNATAFDGIIDFGGTSGNTFNNLSGNASDSVSLTTPVDLALFTGPGSISFPAAAVGSSNATGAGNLISQFSSFAGAGVEVEYIYDEAVVPEPATLALTSLALLGLALNRRKR